MTTDYGTFEYDEGLELSGSDESEMSDMEPDESDLQHKVDTEASPQTLQTNIVTGEASITLHGIIKLHNLKVIDRRL